MSGGTQEYGLLTFSSTHTAHRAEVLLRDLNVRMMPTLREISASCGISLRLPPQAGEEAQARLTGAGLTGWRLYHVLSEGKKPVCTLISPKE